MRHRRNDRGSLSILRGVTRNTNRIREGDFVTRKHLFTALALIASPMAYAQQNGDVEFPARDAIELAPATEQAFDRSGSQMVEKTLPGGMVLVEHVGTLRNVTVARRSADGTIETLCTDDREEALDFLSGADRRSVTQSVNLPGDTQ